MSALNPHIQAELEDRLRFETLLAELSMRFINLPPIRWIRKSRMPYVA